jgi:hypothetical protein
MVHGRGVDATNIVILAFATLSAARTTAAAMIGRTTTAPPPASSSATGGMSRSCVHSFSLVQIPNFSDERLAFSSALCRYAGKHSTLALFRCAETPVRLEKS